MRRPPTRAQPQAAGAGKGRAGHGHRAPRPLARGPRRPAAPQRPPGHRRAHTPGKRSSSAQWPAARSASTSLRLCVLFPARSTPSSTMSAPRRPAILRLLRTIVQSPLPAAARGSHWPESVARAGMAGTFPALVGLARTGPGAGRFRGRSAFSGGAPASAQGSAVLARWESARWGRGEAAGGARSPRSWPSSSGRAAARRRGAVCTLAATQP